MTDHRRGRSAPCARVLSLLLLAAPAAAQTQEERIAALEQEIARLRALLETSRQEAGRADTRFAEQERRIEALAAEIERIGLGEAAAPATADRPGQGLGPAASKIYRTPRGVSIGGYGEAIYTDFEGDPSRLDFLRAVLYAGYRFDESWIFNSEIEFEHASTGEDGEVSVEFAYLDYLWHPEASFRGGLLLVPMGFLNELHEPTTFLSADRPEVERQILPTTWRENGAGLHGEAGPLAYRTYVVNGFEAAEFTAAGLRGGRQQGSEALADDFAWVGRLDAEALPGLVVGGSVYVGDSGQDLGFDVPVSIVEAHADARWRGLQARALVTQADLDDVDDLNAALALTGDDSVGERMRGGYVEVGFDVLTLLPEASSSLVPFVRWETLDTQEEVPSGFSRDPANDRDLWTLGLAFRPIDTIILKADWQWIRDRADERLDEFHVAMGFVF
ncbi:MAG: DUF1192 domain-containing protein [Planctomycetes bacterium]|nr:DUF1192 domain-containing protein [Planctomycetota bacterium]